MTNFTTRFAGLATLLLATMPLVTVATGARAEPVTVQIADIDVASHSGKAAFEARVEQAAREFCNGRVVVGTRNQDNRACIAGVKVEMNEKLAQARTSAPQTLAAR